MHNTALVAIGHSGEKLGHYVLGLCRESSIQYIYSIMLIVFISYMYSRIINRTGHLPYLTRLQRHRLPTLRVNIVMQGALCIGKQQI